jgi:putative ABC transport system permease protein
MSTAWRDIRFAFRLLWNAPGLATLAVVSLGIAIAANTTIFSVVYTVLLAPPVFRDTNRLVVVWESNKAKGIARTPVAPVTFRDWKKNGSAFEGLELVAPGSPVTITGAGLPERANIQYATAGLFKLLGVEPALGRFFAATEETSANAPVLIGYGLWQRRYGGSRSAVNQKIVVNQQVHSIAGVLPRDFHLFDMDTDIWIPIGFPDTRSQDRSFRVWLIAIGKVKTGESLASAQAQMDVLAGRIARAHPDSNKDWGVRIQPIQDAQFGEWKDILYPLWGMVVLVLLIACANVANLFLSRLPARAREISVRAALGATRRRLVLQLVNEGIVVGFLGGALGLLLTGWGIRLFTVLAPDRFPLLHSIHVDAVVLLFCVAMSVASGALLAILPAFIGTGMDWNTALKRTPLGRERVWFRSAFAIVQIALTLVLLLGAGLMIRSFLRVLSVDPGFRSDRIVTMQAFLSGPRYLLPQPDGVHIHDEVGRFYSRLLEQTNVLPGVLSTGLVSWLPEMGYNTGRRERGFRIAGESQAYVADFNTVGGDYFKTLGIPLVAGRAFTADDSLTAPWVAIVNRAFAARYWPAENPIGRQIVTDEQPGGHSREVVGVVADVRQDVLERKPEPELFAPYWQQPRTAFGHGYQNRVHLNIVVRAGGDADSTVAAIRKIAAEIDSSQPLYAVQSMSSVLAESTALRRLHTTLMEIFAGVALFLAAVGIYGVTSGSVIERTAEIGLRMAVGADRSDVYRLFFIQGAKLIFSGLIIGLLLGVAFNRTLSSFLFNTPVYDLATILAVCGLLVGVCIAAICLPARRAVHVDPISALRCE